MRKTPEKDENLVFVFLNRLIRVNDVIRWCAISFIGFILGISTLSFYDNLIPFLVFIICTFCIMSFTFSINNYYDVDSDRENPRRMHTNAIASGRISKQTAVFINIILVLIPLVVSFLFKFILVFYCIIFLFIMWAYSSPPFRLKGRPGIDIIWHLFAFFFIIIWGSLIAGSITLINLLVAISIGVFSCIGQIWNHIIDYSFDKSSNTTTFTVKYGLKKSKKLLHFFVGLHIVFLIPLILFYSINYYESIILFVSLSLLGLIVIRPKKNGFPEKRSYQYYLAVGLGGAVYTSCMIYHLLLISGAPLVYQLFNFT